LTTARLTRSIVSRVVIPRPRRVAAGDDLAKEIEPEECGIERQQSEVPAHLRMIEARLERIERKP
jgi:hypothetical protein